MVSLIIGYVQNIFNLVKSISTQTTQLSTDYTTARAAKLDLIGTGSSIASIQRNSITTANVNISTTATYYSSGTYTIPNPGVDVTKSSIRLLGYTVIGSNLGSVAAYVTLTNSTTVSGTISMSCAPGYTSPTSSGTIYFEIITYT